MPEAAYTAVDLQRYHGAGAGDHRDVFARDRDRILYSSAFRRLAEKTQVVAAGELGDFHTRMTHSLKVAQVGLRLAQRLGQKAEAEGKVGPSPDLVEAACLAHDLGHPPFGHAGEQALNRVADELYRRAASEAETDPDELRCGFEGNAQTYRILVYLSSRPPRESHGLDLTRATLDAVIKYPWYRGTTGKARRKWNAYRSETGMVTWVRNDHGWDDPDSPQSFEAQIMDWSDDITYACHDVEDFYRAGLIPLAELFNSPDNESVSAEAHRFYQYLQTQHADEFDLDEASFVEVWNNLGQFVLFDGPFDQSHEAKVAVHRATSFLITHFIEATSWSGAESGSLGRYYANLEVKPEVRQQNALLQKLIWYYVIDRPQLASQQTGQQRIVRELATVCYEDPTRLLPRDRLDECDAHQDVVRAVVDHVATLGEPAAYALHRRLTGVDVGLFTDPL